MRVVPIPELNKVYLAPPCKINILAGKEFVGYKYTQSGLELRGDVTRWAIDAKGVCVIFVSKGKDKKAIKEFVDDVIKKVTKKDASSVTPTVFKATDFYYSGD